MGTDTCQLDGITALPTIVRIFEKLGWSRQEQLRYDDFRDPVSGEKYISSSIHGNHTEMVSFAKKLNIIPT